MQLNINTIGTTYENTIIKLCNNWNKSGKSRDINFLKTLIQKDYVCGIGVRNKIRFSNFINLITPILNAHHKDNWDINLSIIDNFSNKQDNTLINSIQINIFILYPSITIKNSVEEEHLIKDLLIVLPIHKFTSSIFFKDFKGIRLSVNKQEFHNAYRHSHTNTMSYKYNKNFYSSSFCYGESEISDIISINRNECTPEAFELFIITLDNYLSWESLEGGPHIKMRDVITNAESSSISIDRTDAKNMFNIVNIQLIKNINENDIKNLRVIVQNRSLKFIINDNFKNTIINIIKKFDYDNIKNLIVTKIEDIYYQFNKDDYKENVKEINKDLKNQNLIPSIIFRSKIIDFKVYEKKQETKEEIKVKYELLPKYTKSASNALEQHLYKQVVVNRAIRKENKIRNIQRNIIQNQVPV
jgi:hypothetical protein